MASASPIERRALSGLARLVEEIQPVTWSEHLAFVRAGGIEIGHLAAPPRCEATLEGLARNVRAAASAVGSMPLLENPASLIDPPGSDRAESAFLRDAVAATGAHLLLDLHNLWSNSFNFGFDALDAIAALPAESIRAVHLAGGRFIGPAGGRRRLDDHLHPVPGVVFCLLEEVAARAPQALDVIVERDGRYPAPGLLLDELDRARAAVRKGRMRGRRLVAGLPPASRGRGVGGVRMEALLARLYVDATLRASALADPQETARRSGLTAEESDAFARLDRHGLALAAESFAHKRAATPASAAAGPRR
jgi:uncharacterized protein (UPF0276 family)